MENLKVLDAPFIILELMKSKVNWTKNNWTENTHKQLTEIDKRIGFVPIINF